MSSSEQLSKIREFFDLGEKSLGFSRIPFFLLLIGVALAMLFRVPVLKLSEVSWSSTVLLYCAYLVAALTVAIIVLITYIKKQVQHCLDVCGQARTELSIVLNKIKYSCGFILFMSYTLILLGFLPWFIWHYDSEGNKYLGNVMHTATLAACISAVHYHWIWKFVPRAQNILENALDPEVGAW